MAKQINIKFTKMTGAGNDFILIDNRLGEYTIEWNQLAPQICNRRYGVGADGILIIENSTVADFKMKYYNSDGSYGGMCGNGGRCASLYILKDLKSNKVKFEALDHVYEANRIDDINVKLKMKMPKDIRLNLELNILNAIVPIHFVDTGAPHAVVFTSDLPASLSSKISTNGITQIGTTIRYHDYFSPQGTNVDFVNILRSSMLSMQTYERGVEGETFACGTGAVASSIISSILYNMRLPIQVQTKSKEILTVEFQRDGDNFKDVSLIGSAKKVFEGQFTCTL